MKYILLDTHEEILIDLFFTVVLATVIFPRGSVQITCTPLKLTTNCALLCVLYLTMQASIACNEIRGKHQVNQNLLHDVTRHASFRTLYVDGKICCI